MPTDAPERPDALFRRGLDLLRAKDMPGFIGLFADDAVVEFPFAPPGRPRRLEGRGEVHDYLIDYPDTVDVHRVEVGTLHTTADPEVIVAEFSAEGILVATGDPYEAHYVAVLTVRDGRIAHYRDYWNPRLALAAEGGAAA
ncbi:nuclear transport factor 2 family protein [Nocardiopsis chromatogenes]|uniref:nuclear transport factor 2 family protein n=1 Tax=Nocardiopsis chromatogenes TaxID=280239 RepID=UPI00034B9BBA|nr:nuclear transport factor 2 family protein [Nocardiopsis chromatogenes]